MKPYSLFLRLSLAGQIISQFASATDLRIPSAVRQRIDSAIAIFPSTDLSGTVENPAASRASLKALADLITPELLQAARDKQGEFLDAKLVVLADALTREPARFDEIQRYYITDGGKNALYERSGGKRPEFLPIVVFAPMLRPEHATAEYRLAWEFFTLMSWIRGAPSGFSDLTETALVKIGDPRSVPVIEYRYSAAATDPRMDPNRFNRLLLEFPSETALRALLICVEEWNKQAEVRQANASSLPPGLSYADAVGAENAGADPTAEIKKMRLESPKKADAWRDVVSKGVGANRNQKLILEKIKVALQAN